MTISAPDASSAAASSPSDRLARATLIMDLAVAATMLGREAARAAGVDQPASTWFALAELLDQPLRLGEVARRIGLSQPATSALVRKLTAQGRIEIVHDPDDGRATVLRLTAVGRADLQGWRAQASKQMSAALEGTSTIDDGALQRALEIITSRRGLVDVARRTSASAERSLGSAGRPDQLNSGMPDGTLH